MRVLSMFIHGASSILIYLIGAIRRFMSEMKGMDTIADLD